MDTNFDYKREIKFFKENYIVVIWLLLVGAALFNFGYFWLLDIKYIGFLGISDYYASSFIYLCSMFFVLWGVSLFTDRPRDNIVFVTSKLTFESLVLFSKIIFYKIQVKIDEYLVVFAEKTICYNKSSKHRKKTDDIHKKIQATKTIIAGIKKRNALLFNRIIKAFRKSLAVLLGSIFLLFMVFWLLYRTSGLFSSIALFFMAIILIGTDSFLKKVNMGFFAPIVTTGLLALFAGVCMLSHDIINNRIEVCDNQNCYDVIRKTTDGYFVIDDEKLFFLDNDLNIKTQQKRPAIIDLVESLD